MELKINIRKMLIFYTINNNNIYIHNTSSNRKEFIK